MATRPVQGGSTDTWGTELNAWLDEVFAASSPFQVNAASTANLTLSGTQTVDGVALVAGNVCLAKNQTTTSANGVYVVAAGAWTRHTWSDTAGEIAGLTVRVQSGTVNGGKRFGTTFKGTDTLGTTAMTWYELPDLSALETSVALGAPNRSISMTAASLASALASNKYYKLPPGTITLDAPLLMPAGSVLEGCGTATVLKIANSVSSSYVVGGIGDGTGTGQQYEIRNLIVDGNSAGGAVQTDAAVYFEQPSDLTVENLHCRNSGGTVGTTSGGGGGAGFRVSGLGLMFTYNIKINGIHCYNNTGCGLETSHTNRKTLISNVYVHDNGIHGYWLDASEQNVDMVTAWNNTKRGVYINNVHSDNVGQILAYNNGWTGIWVEEFIFSSGHDWLAIGNGANDTNIKAEVCFTSDVGQSYGISRCSTVRGIRTVTDFSNSMAAVRVAQYGLYVGDDVVDRMSITDCALEDSGTIAPYRLPATTGSLHVTDTAGNVLATQQDFTNLYSADPGTASGTAATNWTPQNGTATNAVVSGRQAVRFTDSGGTAHNLMSTSGTAIDVTAYAGGYIAISVDAIKEAGTYTGQNLAARFYDNAVALISSVNAYGSATGITPQTGWGRLYGVFAVPAGSVTMRVHVMAKPDSTTATFAISRIQVVGGKAVPRYYFDGDTAGAYWTGNARASTSVKPAIPPVTLPTDFSTATASAPTTGLTIFARHRARRLPAFIGPTGQDSQLQPAWFSNRISMLTAAPGQATPQYIGVTPTASTTAPAAVTPTAPNAAAGLGGSVHRHRYSTAAATAGSGGGFRLATQPLYMTSAANAGGFFIVMRFGLLVNVGRVSFGLSNVTTQIAPGSDVRGVLTNFVGFAKNQADTTFYAYAVAGTAGTNTAVNTNVATASTTSLYEARLFTPSAGGFICYWSLQDFSAGTFAQGTINTNLPALNTALYPHMEFSNGTTAATGSIDIQSLYIETDN